jgi:hypothetical protein
MINTAAIDARTNHQAVHVVALGIDHQTPLPAPIQLQELQTAFSHTAANPDLQPHRRADTPLLPL